MLAAILPACRSGRSVVNHYYLLELPSQAVENVRAETPMFLGKAEVFDVLVAPSYASHQIAIREESHRIRYFSFNEWAIRPGVALSAAAFNFFKLSGAFTEIIHGWRTEDVDYLIETEVFHLEVDDRDGLFQARLHLEFTVSNARNGEILYRHRADRYDELPERSLNLFAETVSRLFADELTAFVRALGGEVR